jgi:hypothetical protein
MPGMRMVVRNLGSVPVTIDRAGHQLGAGEFGVAADTDYVTAAALAAGKIGQVLQPDDSADVDPAAAAAFAQLADDDASAPAPASSDAPDGAEESSKATTARAKGNR